MISKIATCTFRSFVFFILSICVQWNYACSANERQFSGQVTGVTDGDTIKVFHDGSLETIRLSGVDCPEKGQAFGGSARSFTSALCFGKIVIVDVKTRDRYGRTIGDVLLSDGRDLKHELINSGYAWWYQKYSPFDTALQEMELSARSKHVGLWADPNPTPPWNFRRQRRAN